MRNKMVVVHAKYLVFLLLALILTFGRSRDVYAQKVTIKGPSKVYLIAGIEKRVRYTLKGSGINSLYFDEYYRFIKNKKLSVETYFGEGNCDEDPELVCIYTNKVGKFSLTIKQYYIDKNGKDCVAKKKVTVISRRSKSICPGGGIRDYSLRNDYFIAYIKNYAEKPLTILPSGARAINSYDKDGDSNLTILGNKPVVIKPGKTKKIYFKVLGDVYGDLLSDYTINCRCIYKKKQYKLKIYPCEALDGWGGIVKVKIKGKWKDVAKVPWH